MTTILAINSLRNVWPVWGGLAGHQHTEEWLEKGCQWVKVLTTVHLFRVPASLCRQSVELEVLRELQVIYMD